MKQYFGVLTILFFFLMLAPLGGCGHRQATDESEGDGSSTQTAIESPTPTPTPVAAQSANSAAASPVFDLSKCVDQIKALFKDSNLEGKIQKLCTAAKKNASKK